MEFRERILYLVGIQAFDVVADGTQLMEPQLAPCSTDRLFLGRQGRPSIVIHKESLFLLSKLHFG